MPVVINNNFSQDTYGMRAERLIAIQGNFASIQSELNAPEHIVEWAADCSDAFNEIIATSEIEFNESEGATAVVEEKEILMDEEYQNVRSMGITIYKNNRKYYEDYGFEKVYPSRRSDKIRRVESVIDVYARHIADSVTPLIPQLLITRLTNAFNNFKEALANQDKERSDARHSHNTASIRFESDTKMLNQLKTWWFAMLGKDDGRISLVGMVNPSTGSAGGNLAAPQNFRFDFIGLNFWWDIVPKATSYQLERLDGEEYVEIYSGTETSFHYVPPDGQGFYRVRARNVKGYGAFTENLEQWYYAVLPSASNLAISESDVDPGHFILTWDAVPTATEYSVYRSVVEIGQSSADFSLLGKTAENTFPVSLEAGKRNYFRVNTKNLSQYAAPSAAIWMEP